MYGAGGVSSVRRTGKGREQERKLEGESKMRYLATHRSEVKLARIEDCLNPAEFLDLSGLIGKGECISSVRVHQCEQLLMTTGPFLGMRTGLAKII